MWLRLSTPVPDPTFVRSSWHPLPGTAYECQERSHRLSLDPETRERDRQLPDLKLEYPVLPPAQPVVVLPQRLLDEDGPGSTGDSRGDVRHDLDPPQGQVGGLADLLRSSSPQPTGSCGRKKPGGGSCLVVGVCSRGRKRIGSPSLSVGPVPEYRGSVESGP